MNMARMGKDAGANISLRNQQQRPCFFGLQVGSPRVSQIFRVVAGTMSLRRRTIAIYSSLCALDLK
jgi:hypothetical protein